MTAAGKDAAAGDVLPGDLLLRDLAARVLDLLVRDGTTLAVAESLTGGLVAAELTSVPGASRALRGGVTAYATDVKRDVLGVDGTLLAERGAVDPDVARQMATGIRRVLAAGWGIATTGVAGPDPQDGQPVGTVYVAVSGPHGAGKVAALRLNGDREEIRRESVRSVLELLSGELTGNGRTQDTERNGGDLMFAALSEHDIAPRTAAARGGTVGREGCGYAVRGGSHR